MPKRLKKILDRFASGEIKTTYNLNLSLEDFLTKDEDGITFLEHLLGMGASVYFIDEEKLKNSIEAGFIYCKFNKGLYSFEYSEEDLFTHINGKLFIEHIIEADKITSDMIREVKNHVEIIDLLGKEKSYKFSCLSNEVKNKLTTKNEDGIYPIEKYVSGDDNYIFKNLISEYDNPSVIIELCKKYNKYDLLKFINENALMYEISDNHTLLDDLMGNEILPTKLASIPENIKFVNFLREKNLYEYLKDAQESVLCLNIENEKTLLEELIEKNLINELDFSVYNEKTIYILSKLNKLDLLKKIDQDLLVKPTSYFVNENSTKTLLEYLLDNGIKVTYNSFGSKEEKIIKILYNRGEFELISKSIDKRKLFLEIEEGIPLIDKLLENNLDINFGYGGFDDERIANRIYAKGKLDLLLEGSLSVILKNANDKETYLDIILEAIKSKKIKYNLNNFSLHNEELKDVSKFYLAIAKHDMMGYINELNEEKLLKKYKEETLLNELLNQDPRLTLSKVISDDVKSNLKVATIIKSKGLEQNDINIPLDQKDFTKEYLDRNIAKLGIGPIQYDGITNLEKLRELLLNDEQSDKELVEALIAGYRQALFIDYDTVTKELENLIKIKENNSKAFTYEREENNAFFSKADGAVHADNTTVETLLHETGHALHSYLTEYSMPEEYDAIVKEVRENKEVLKRVNCFSNNYFKIKEKVKELVNKKYKSFFENYYTEEKEKEIEEFIQKSLLEKKEEFKELELPKEVLDVVLSNMFTKEEYINHQKKIFIEENIDVICRTEYGNLMAIADILDAIYEGELHTGTLKNEKGEKIKRTPGHGISYYYDQPDKCFCEMVANFASISKSRNALNSLDMLKAIVGDKLYNMLSDYYYINISKTKEETNENSRRV